MSLFKRQFHTKSPYIHAIHAMLKGDINLAFDLFKKTVSQDSGNIEAYIFLGNLLREKGQPLRAIRIRRQLLARSDIDQMRIQTIIHQLALDYQQAGLFDQAIEMAERLYQSNRKYESAQNLLLQLYEQKKDWSKAFTFLKNNKKPGKGKDKMILALYKIEEGKQAVKAAGERDGRLKFREAIKLDSSCTPAYLELGDSYIRQQRPEDALKAWVQLAEKNPDQAFLAFERLHETLFNLDRFEDVEGIYKKILKLRPDNTLVLTYLIDYLIKLGKDKEAMELCRKIEPDDPNFARSRQLIAILLEENGDIHAALKESKAAMEQCIKQSSLFYCSICENRSKEPIWYCPGCGQWNSYLNG